MGCKLGMKICIIDQCEKESSVYGLCRYHYYRSDKYRELDKKRYINNIEHERERSKIKNKAYPLRNQKGIEYRTRIAKTLGLSYTQFTHQLQLVKKTVLQRDGACVHCGDKAEIVHHELDRKTYPEFTLTENNMIALCESCHKIEHGIIMEMND